MPTKLFVCVLFLISFQLNPVNCGLDECEYGKRLYRRIAKKLYGVNQVDNFISPEDLNSIYEVFDKPSSTTAPPEYSTVDPLLKNLTEGADCFGLGGITSKLKWILNLKPMESHEINASFYLFNRKQNYSVQIYNDAQFGLEWTHFDPQKNTIVIVHGFLSYGEAGWVKNMTKAILGWDDVNVITVDWSGGGNTWKYWRAVANTRTVGADLAKLVSRLVNETGMNLKQFHFIGHSLGAHICSYASFLLGKVRRITGLDPAQPCFQTNDINMMLDKTDADFVDIIHTNARNISKYGLGLQIRCGHQDFYPNGGMKQPGCHSGSRSIFRRFMPATKSRIERMVCNHGRAYLLFTESFKETECKNFGYQWDRSISSINSSINAGCNEDNCVEMGINAEKYPARGSFYVMTTSKKPFCERSPINIETRSFLLTDIEGSQKNKSETLTNPSTAAPIVKRGRWLGWFGM